MIDEEKSVQELFQLMLDEDQSIEPQEEVEISIQEIFNESLLHTNSIKFGNWTVLDYAGTDKGNNKMYNCKCICGSIHAVRLARLKNKKTTQCRSCAQKDKSKTLTNINTERSQHHDIDSYLGKRFGNRTIIEIGKYFDATKTRMVKCQCTCMEIKLVRWIDLKKGKSNSCRKCMLLCK